MEWIQRLYPGLLYCSKTAFFSWRSSLLKFNLRKQFRFVVLILFCLTLMRWYYIHQIFFCDKNNFSLVVTLPWLCGSAHLTADTGDTLDCRLAFSRNISHLMVFEPANVVPQQLSSVVMLELYSRHCELLCISALYLQSRGEKTPQNSIKPTTFEVCNSAEKFLFAFYCLNACFQSPRIRTKDGIERGQTEIKWEHRRP